MMEAEFALREVTAAHTWSARNPYRDARVLYLSVGDRTKTRGHSDVAHRQCGEGSADRWPIRLAEMPSNVQGRRLYLPDRPDNWCTFAADQTGPPPVRCAPRASEKNPLKMGI